MDKTVSSRIQPIEQSCYWLSQRQDYLASAKLEGQNQSAEIVIVGGGFTGLWTAYFLKELSPDLDVAVVEQAQVGYGASGRNAGIVGTCLDFSPELSIIHFGKREAETLACIGRRNIEELAAFATDCDFEQVGQLHVALNDAQLKACQNSVQVASELGFQGYELLGKDELQQELNSPLYQGGIFMPDNGIIDPLKLVDKLKTASMEKGVRFFENSRVTGIEGHRVDTEDASIRFGRLVLATDSYSHHLAPRLLRYFIPVHEYVLASDPLTDAEMNLIGWQNRQGVTDGRIFFNYYRLTADNRIIWGGTSEAVYYSQNQVNRSCDYSKTHFDALHESFKLHFPQLTQLKFPYAWGGPIAVSTRLTPFFGTLCKGRIIYGLGYSGHGIGSTRLAGKILSHIAVARRSELLDLQMVRFKPFPCPPASIRTLSVQALSRSLQNLDQGCKPDLFLQALKMFGMDFTH